MAKEIILSFFYGRYMGIRGIFVIAVVEVEK